MTCSTVTTVGPERAVAAIQVEQAHNFCAERFTGLLEDSGVRHRTSMQRPVL